MNGLVIVDKPEGYTSRDIVNLVGKALKTKKVGHTGTLDPLATGVLVCTVGKCTKLNDFLMSTTKEYEVEMILGIDTDTLDTTGKILHKKSVNYSKKEITSAVLSFIGEYCQQVPAYSAVKVNGKKLYEYARENKEVDLPSKIVKIYSIDNLTIEGNTVSFKAIVSKGTYIRSLVRDIGLKLGSYAVMSKLRRCKQGEFSLQNANTIEEIKNNRIKLVSIDELFKDFYTINANEEMCKTVSNGVKLEIDSEEEYIIFKYDNQIICMYKKDNKEFRMYIKF